MGEAKNFPMFLTDLMVKWLDVYERERVDTITFLGLFNWKETLNNKNSTSLKKQPVIDLDFKLSIRTLPLDYGIYFHEVSQTCLHVLHIIDAGLGAKSTAFEYQYKSGEFQKTNKVLM